MPKVTSQAVADAVVRQAETEHRLSELLDLVAKETGADETSIKAIVLRLNSQGLIELTADWKVIPHKRDAA